MSNGKTHAFILLVLAGLMVAAWAILIWIASIVTGSMLSTLHYIVELSQMK
jgi:hypothetical protein